jgi:hypothetical protein
MRTVQLQRYRNIPAMITDLNPADKRIPYNLPQLAVGSSRIELSPRKRAPGQNPETLSITGAGDGN